jgi:hypothetical protein
MALVLIALFLPVSSFAQQLEARDLLWQDRGNISELDLIGGPGGSAHQPGARFKFIKESANGTAPKFEVEDENGVKWKVKLGPEVKAETAATRLVWAAGYFVDEDYYRPEIQVDGLKRLKRGQEFVRGNTVVNVRLERHHGGSDDAEWSWFDNSFLGTREFNGLRVMMVLINNWDLKDVNNAVYAGPKNNIYVVADLGASFGRTGNNFKRTKGVATDYANTAFIRKVSGQYVDFVLHSRPFLLSFFTSMGNYFSRTKMEALAKHVPIEDARWVGGQMGRLSTNQISDCFRAGGFSPKDVDTYTRVVMHRIAELNQL